jgi:predicted nucleic acid-binding protein
MKNYYLDTNVLLSQYKREDPFYQESALITNALKTEDIEGYTSTITILEACAFITRNFPPKKGETPREGRIIAVSKILKELSKLRLVYINPLGDYPLRLDGQEVQMPAMLHQALLLSPEIGLRALDLLHLSAAKYARKTGADIRGFVTGDSDFIKIKKTFSKIIDIPILSPRELVDTLGINET